MKKPQLITVLIGLVLIAGIYFFVRRTPSTKTIVSTERHVPDDGHDHGETSSITIDTILALAKKQLSPEQVIRISTLENSLSRGDVKDQQVHVYHQLARFWADSAGVFEAYAWYQAEAARLENSEKTLTFAAQLFLDSLQWDEVTERRKWKALQAKDLFERSLQINPANDSAKVGLGAAYLFGGISTTPMEGILKIREVVERDSTNAYAQMMLGKASLISGQYDKAIGRFQTVCRLEPDNLDAILLLAGVYERMGDKKNAADCYGKSLRLVKQSELKKAIEQRIGELRK
ncbi:MAG TPA: tetratricopeptide repeat protein [Chitinophagaceae bacterium]|nr:tetratricopeptide repeat protein [Chitinophagaceae bacterium]